MTTAIKNKNCNYFKFGCCIPQDCIPDEPHCFPRTPLNVNFNMGKRKKLQRLSFGEEGDGEKKTYLYSISCVLAMMTQKPQFMLR